MSELDQTYTELLQALCDLANANLHYQPDWLSNFVAQSLEEPISEQACEELRDMTLLYADCI